MAGGGGRWGGGVGVDDFLTNQLKVAPPWKWIYPKITSPVYATGHKQIFSPLPHYG